MKALFTPIFLSALLASACSDGGQNGESSPAGTEANSMSPTSLQTRVEAEARAQLKEIITPFLRGDSLVYQGTFEARDNLSVIEGADDILPKGPALAALAPTIDDHGKAQIGLTVTSLVDGSHVGIFQPKDDAHKTFATLVGSRLTGVDTFGSNQICVDCASKFSARPPALSVAFTAIGTYFDADRTPSRTTVAGSLTLKPARELQFTDLQALSLIAPALADYTQKGAEFVRTERNVASKSVPIPAHTHHLACFEVTNYSFDVYVGAKDLSNVGTGNFHQEPSKLQCCDSAEACGG